MDKKLTIFIIFLITTTLFSQSNILSEKAIVSVLNCDTGNESYSLYGHTAIRIKDTENNLDVVYNYGAFDFSTPNFMLKFIKGDLQYFVTTDSYANFEYNYKYEKRSIFEQKLNLNTIQKQTLFNELNASLMSDKRFYTYKFIDRNCTTMVIDKVNNVLGNLYIDTSKPVVNSYRDILYPYAENHFFEKLGINIIFGAKVDKPADRLFLPLEFIKVLEKTVANDKNIAQPVNILYQAPKNDYKPPFWNSIYTIIILLIGVVLINKRSITNAYFILQGVLGIFFSLVGLYSFHEEVLWNYNVLLFNPLYLMFFYYYWKNNQAKTLRIGQILLLFLIFYLLYMLNKVHLTIMLPFIITNGILLRRIILKEKNNVYSKN